MVFFWTSWQWNWRPACGQASVFLCSATSAVVTSAFCSKCWALINLSAARRPFGQRFPISQTCCSSCFLFRIRYRGLGRKKKEEGRKKRLRLYILFDNREIEFSPLRTLIRAVEEKRNKSALVDHGWASDCSARCPRPLRASTVFSDLQTISLISVAWFKWRMVERKSATHLFSGRGVIDSPT